MILADEAPNIAHIEAQAWQLEINQAQGYPAALRSIAERLLAKLMQANAQRRDLEMIRHRQEHIIQNQRKEIAALMQQLEVYERGKA